MLTLLKKPCTIVVCKNQKNIVGYVIIVVLLTKPILTTQKILLKRFAFVSQKRSYQKMSDQIVHCLLCDLTYPEQKPMVKVCPHCGNDDVMSTVFLSEDNSEVMEMNNVCR